MLYCIIRIFIIWAQNLRNSCLNISVCRIYESLKHEKETKKEQQYKREQKCVAKNVND